MKALRLHGIGDLRLHEEEAAQPGPGEALLRVTAVGICGSDIHWYAEGTTGEAGFGEPFVLGHEFAAVVESGDMAGARVAVEPHVNCGQCEFCLDGKPNLCPHHYFAGQAPQDGALRDLMAWPEAFVFPIPDMISDGEAAMLEPLGVALHTVDQGKMRSGMRAGVYGCGPIGLLLVQMAKLSGAAQIVATDKLPHRLEAAKRMGATAVFLAGEESEEIDPIMAATQGHGVDVAFEAAGDQGAVDTAVETVKSGGRVVLCGIPSEDRISFHASTARRKEVAIQAVRRSRHAMPRAIRMVESGLVDVQSLISHRFPLEHGAEAFRVAERREGLKVLIEVE